MGEDDSVVRPHTDTARDPCAAAPTARAVSVPPPVLDASAASGSSGRGSA